MPKTKLSGEKYIYALMAIMLCKARKEKEKSSYMSVGRDIGMKGQQHFARGFCLLNHDGKTMLIERKSSANMADFSRSYEYREYENNIVIDAPSAWVH